MKSTVKQFSQNFVTSGVNGVCYGLLPIKQNDYRPLALRHKPLTFISALLISIKVLAIGVIALTPTTAELSTITSNRIVQLTNAEREKVGLNSLTVNAKLSTAAQQKGAHMLQEDYFAHISPSGVTPWFWMQKAGYTYKVAGENLAIDFIEAEDVVAAWLASPTHKENMLLPEYTETGVAAVTGEYQGGTSTIVVHMFGLPSTASKPASAGSTTGTTQGDPVISPKPSPIPDASKELPIDTTPPGTPRIVLENNNNIIQDKISFVISGEPESTVYLLINSQQRSAVKLPTSGSVSQTLDISDISDGTIVLRSFATDTVNNQSDVSDPLAFTKDTVSPELTPTELSFVLLPNFSDPKWLATVNTTDANKVIVTADEDQKTYDPNEQIIISARVESLRMALRDDAGNISPTHDIQLVPNFAAEASTAFIKPPARFSQTMRVVAMLAFLIIAILLSLTVVVNIRIQRPALIAHASLVLLIAGLVLFI